jgi:hypothetical protein
VSKHPKKKNPREKQARIGLLAALSSFRVSKFGFRVFVNVCIQVANSADAQTVLVLSGLYRKFKQPTFCSNLFLNHKQKDVLITRIYSFTSP